MSDRLGKVATPASWTLPGVGPFGTDVEVVSLEAYLALAQRCRNAEAAALIWSRKAALLERGKVPPLADDDVVRALRLPLAAVSEDPWSAQNDEAPAP